MEAEGLRAASPRGLRIGDVLLYADAEIWLAGEVHLDEEGFALSLFPTPGAPRSTFVAQLDEHAREIALVEGANLIGRGADCQVRIDLPDISRHHARIQVAGDVATIEDLGSKSGTCISGKPVLGPTSLWEGAEIVVGSEPLVFRVSGASRSTRTGKRRG